MPGVTRARPLWLGIDEVLVGDEISDEHALGVHLPGASDAVRRHASIRFFAADDFVDPTVRCACGFFDRSRRRLSWLVAVRADRFSLWDLYGRFEVGPGLGGNLQPTCLVS